MGFERIKFKMNMIEKVAKAIHSLLLKDDWSWVEENPTTMNCVTLDGNFDLNEIAKAAIEAMKEPTEEMVKEGLKYVDWNMGAKEAYQAMIETALNS